MIIALIIGYFIRKKKLALVKVKSFSNSVIFVPGFQSQQTKDKI